MIVCRTSSSCGLTDGETFVTSLVVDSKSGPFVGVAFNFGGAHFPCLCRRIVTADHPFDVKLPARRFISARRRLIGRWPADHWSDGRRRRRPKEKSRRRAGNLQDPQLGVAFAELVLAQHTFELFRWLPTTPFPLGFQTIDSLIHFRAPSAFKFALISE